MTKKSVTKHGPSELPASAEGSDTPRTHDIATVVQLASQVAKAHTGSPEELVRLLKMVTVGGKNRLRDVAKMAEGGMGEVHLAVDQVLHRRIAKKVINPNLKDDLVHARMFIREAQIVSQLDHPSIVPVHDIGVDETGALFFTMKLVRGRTLGELIRELPDGPIAPAVLFNVLEIMLKVCDALALAHNRGVLHCDVKPANIMVGDYGEVYLMDWGVAQLIADGATQVSADDIQGPGDDSDLVSLGTLGYMSPEQLQRDALSPATDIFCLGAVLYEIVTRRAPYSGSSMTAAMEKVQRVDFKPPEEVVGRDRCPPGLRRMIMRAMARDPHDRYITAGDFKRDLLGFMRGDGAFERARFSAGTVIVMEGDAGNCAYIIESGKCDVFRVVKGERVALGMLGPGDVFGEMAVLSPGPRTANVVASEDVVAQVVHGDVLKRELDSMRPWMGLVVRRLADRLRDDRTTQSNSQVRYIRIAQQVTMYLCTWGRRGPGRALSDELTQVAKSLEPRLGVNIDKIRSTLAHFPGLQQGGTPTRVWMRDPPATLGSLWRADETGDEVPTANHRELAEQIAMYLCTWGRTSPPHGLSVDLDTLCQELAPRINQSEKILRTAVADFTEFTIDDEQRILTLAEPKSLMQRLWPKQA